MASSSSKTRPKTEAKSIAPSAEAEREATMSSTETADIVVEVMRALAEEPRSADELSDALWSRMRSPSATTPAVVTLLEFLKRKGLASQTKHGVYQLTDAGRGVLEKAPVPV